MRRRRYFTKANRTKAKGGREPTVFASVFLHNMLAGKSKSEIAERKRVERVQFLLDKHQITSKSAREIVEQARVQGIRIDQIESRIVAPMKEGGLQVHKGKKQENSTGPNGFKVLLGLLSILVAACVILYDLYAR